MAERPTVVEMKERLAECARHCGGAIPRDAALVWDGYFAALIEWGLISPAEHAELLGLLPENAPHAARVEVLMALARAQAATGRFEDSRAALLEAIALTPSDNTPRGER